MIKDFEKLILKLSPNNKRVVIAPQKGMHGVAKINHQLRDGLSKSFEIVSHIKKSSDLVIITRLDPKGFLNGFKSDIYIFHDAISYKYLGKIKGKIAYFMQSCYLKRSSHIVCISEYSKAQLIHFHPYIDTKKITIIYNDLESENFTQRPYVLWIGSNKAHKRINLLYELAVLCPDIDFIVITNSLAGCDDQSNLTHMTNVNDIVLKQLLTHASGLVCTSAEEGFFLPFIEALNYGVTCFGLHNAIFEELYISNDSVVLEDTVEKLAKELRKSCQKLN